MGIRQQLAPEALGKITCLSLACHTLSKKEKKSVCECMHDIKVPQGYSSNIKFVSMKGSLVSHNFYVLMQILLLVPIRGI